MRSEQQKRFAIGCLTAIAGFFLTLVPATAVQAQTLTVLHTFTGQGDGAAPIAGLTMDRAGNLYGTTAGFIGTGNGTVFKLSRAGSGWVLRTLYAFRGGMDGATPQARVLFGRDGTLYGTTTFGGLGYGTVFNLRPPATACRTIQCPWTETVLYRFTGGSDGAYPQYGDLNFDANGNIYGTAPNGGSDTCDQGCGVVFELSRSGGGWTESVLHTFTGPADGENPYAGVIFDGAGNLYGTTLISVYELVPSGFGWTETTLYKFRGQGDGETAYGGLIFDQQGNLYGTTYSGGGQNGGASTVYELQHAGGNWTEQVLAITGTGASDTPTMDAAGNLYATYGGEFFANFGSIFEVSPGNNGWTYTDLFNFGGNRLADGFGPVGGIVLDASGNLYGTTFDGGDESCGEGCGVVWELTP